MLRLAFMIWKELSSKNFRLKDLVKCWTTETLHGRQSSEKLIFCIASQRANHTNEFSQKMKMWNLFHVKIKSFMRILYLFQKLKLWCQDKVPLEDLFLLKTKSCQDKVPGGVVGDWNFNQIVHSTEMCNISVTKHGLEVP